MRPLLIAGALALLVAAVSQAAPAANSPAADHPIAIVIHGGAGTGEYYMRLDLTKSISDLMAMKGWSLAKAADYMVMDRLVKFGGENSGGVIALDAKGDIATPFNTPGMYRGWIGTDGKLVVKIYGNE